MKTTHDLFRALLRRALSDAGVPAAELDARTKQYAQEYFDQDPEAAACRQKLTDEEFAYRLQATRHIMPQFLLNVLGTTFERKNEQN